jgi:hypothetical protein
MNRTRAIFVVIITGAILFILGVVAIQGISSLFNDGSATAESTTRNTGQESGSGADSIEIPADAV